MNVPIGGRDMSGEVLAVFAGMCTISGVNCMVSLEWLVASNLRGECIMVSDIFSILGETHSHMSFV